MRLRRRRSCRQEAEARGRSVHMGVDGECRATERERQDAGGRLWADTRKRHQVTANLLVGRILHPGKVEASFPGPDLAEDREEARGFRVRKTTDPNRPNHVADPRRCQRIPARETGPQRLPGSIPVQVGGVLGQDGEDQLIERVQPAGLGQRPVGPTKPVAELGDLSQVRSAGWSPRAKLRNCVRCERNVSLILSVGPFRCFAMLISARPFTEGSSV